MSADKRIPRTFNIGENRMTLAIVIGASGAVASFKGFGAVSVARTAAGTYAITLDEKHGRVQCLKGSVLRAVGAATLEPRTNTVYTPSKTLAFETVLAAGTATDPSSGDVIYVEVTFDDSNGIL